MVRSPEYDVIGSIVDTTKPTPIRYKSAAMSPIVSLIHIPKACKKFFYVLFEIILLPELVSNFCR